MARINVPFVIEGQNIVQKPKVSIAAGGQNYFYATFNLCKTWSNIEYKKASFKRGNDAYVMELVEGNNCLECLIPWEVMATDGYFDVGVFGGSRLPTSTARVFVTQGCACDGNKPLAPTEDWFVETDNRIKKLEDGSSALLFVDGEVVWNPVGEFNVGDSLQGLTIKEIIAKMLNAKVSVNAESITLDKQELIMNVGDIEKLIATVLPDNTTDKTVVWVSSNDNIAKIENESVIAVGKGSATITATTVNGLSAECIVTVIVFTIIEQIVADEIPMLSGSEDGLDVVDYNYIPFTPIESVSAPTASGFYQIVDNGVAIESGYQLITESTGRTSYAMAIPEGATIVEVHMWDEPTSTWVDYSPVFTQTGTTSVNGYTYVIYTSDDSSSGETLRFVIK